MYYNQAENYATNKRKEYEQSLSYLTDNLAQQNTLNQENLKNQYDNLVSTLNNNYQKDAKAAYINKMLTGQMLDESLANLGVNSQGFGLTQRLNNETAYGANLANLQGKLGDDLTDAGNNYQNSLNTLQSNYLEALSNARLKQQQMADDYYNSVFSNYMNDLQYADDVAYRNAQIAASAKNVDTFGWQLGTQSIDMGNGQMLYVNPDGSTRIVDKGTNPYTQSTHGDAGLGTFSNGYQPNNIKGAALTPTNKFTITSDGNRQNIWQTPDGQTYIWSGKANAYYKCTIGKKQSDGTYKITIGAKVS